LHAPFRVLAGATIGSLSPFFLPSNAAKASLTASPIDTVTDAGRRRQRTTRSGSKSAQLICTHQRWLRSSAGPERAGLDAVDDADLRAGPPRSPAVGFTFAAVGSDDVPGMGGLL
jgi:hypothetical protein